MQKPIRQKKMPARNPKASSGRAVADFRRMTALEQAMHWKKNMKPAELKKCNASVAQLRLRKLDELRRLLRDKKAGPILLDFETRNVARLFARLPFGCIHDSCAGHFMDQPMIGKRIAFEKIGQNQRVYATGTDFEIVLDLSEPAMEFRKALEEFGKKFSYKSVLLTSSFIYVHVPVNPEKRFGKKLATQIRKANLQLIKAFEEFLEPFAKKYGVPVKL